MYMKMISTKGKLQTFAFMAAVGLSAAFLIACAGVEKAPIQQNIAKAESAISDARNSDARTHAPLELSMAVEKLSKARTAFEDEEYQEADWLAEESIIEAKLAEAKARSAKSQTTVQELQDTIQTLQNEIQRQRTQ